MNKKSGISILSLIITIIVIIIITSITVYNGIDALESAKEKNAVDTLKIICNAMSRDDSFLVLDASGDCVLTENNFKYMDLEGYYSPDVIVRVNKLEEIDTNKVKTIKYSLTYEEINSTKKYTHSYTFEIQNEVVNYNIVFDVEKGVNMPLVLKGMKPLMMDGKTEVEDVFKDNWYSYEKKTGSFARVEYNGKIYVWIPRFAYKMQMFYLGNSYPEVPSTAIDIVFVRGNSNYMSNEERLPTEYKIHPAFSVGGIEYSGLWFEETAVHTISNLNSGSIVQTQTGAEGKTHSNLHMMTNMEAGAAMYLLYAYECLDEIELNQNEYVAANVGGPGPFDSNFVTVYEAREINNRLTGDAIKETPWQRVIANYPTTDKPYIIRRYGSSLFDFTNSNGSDEALARSVIAIY